MGRVRKIAIAVVGAAVLLLAVVASTDAASAASSGLTGTHIQVIASPGQDDSTWWDLAVLVSGEQPPQPVRLVASLDNREGSTRDCRGIGAPLRSCCDDRQKA
jgi:hypothetical protein